MNIPGEGVDAWVSKVAQWPADDGVEVVVAPPFPYLERIARTGAGSSLRLAAQNVSEHEKGAFTGEVSTSILRDIGCTDVIIGHSERRQLFAETDDRISQKLQAAAKAGLRPILCIGESGEIRAAGKTVEHVDSQLKAALGTSADSRISSSPTSRSGRSEPEIPPRSNRCPKLMEPSEKFCAISDTTRFRCCMAEASNRTTPPSLPPEKASTASSSVAPASPPTPSARSATRCVGRASRPMSVGAPPTDG